MINNITSSFMIWLSPNYFSFLLYKEKFVYRNAKTYNSQVKNINTTDWIQPTFSFRLKRKND